MLKGIWWLRSLSPKLVLTLVTFVIVITVPQFVPWLYNYRVFEWSTVPAVLDFQPRLRTSSPVEDEFERLRPDMAPVKSPDSRIRDPHGYLGSFYEVLRRIELDGSGVARILHYGDSPTTADMITADVRRLLQQRFGDAGHGTYLIAKPWEWYKHSGIEVSSRGWTINPATARQQKDGRYGLAGVSFTGRAGARSRYTLSDEGHTSLTVSYLGYPGGGDIEVLAGGVAVGNLETGMPETTAAEQTFRVPPGATEFEIKVNRGTVRLFSVTFLKPGPGIVYDSLGLNGTWAGVLASYVNERHWSEMLKMANADLVILNYGTNESGYPSYIATSYAKDMRVAVRRIKTALPDVPVLVMSPMDRGVREAGGRLGTIAGLPRLVAIQAEVAAESGCAFFNTFQAMGGPGTMGKWYMAEPRLVSADFMHPMPSGARIVGTLLYQALTDGYNEYKLSWMRRTLAGRRGSK